MKRRLLAGAVIMAPPPLQVDTPEPDGSGKGAKPIATIGTMQRHTTREQRELHGRMKRDMKKAARNIRYQGLQEQEARDKP